MREFCFAGFVDQTSLQEKLAFKRSNQGKKLASKRSNQGKKLASKRSKQASKLILNPSGIIIG